MGIIMWVSKCLKVVDYKNHMIHMIEPYEYWVKQQNIKSTKHKIFL